MAADSPGIAFLACIVANHVSWFDIPALLDALPPYGFLAKRELEKIPLFGPAARAAGVIYIDRENRKAAFSAIDDAASKIRAGQSVLVYPEGTRGDAVRPASLQEGGVRARHPVRCARRAGRDLRNHRREPARGVSRVTRHRARARAGSDPHRGTGLRRARCAWPRRCAIAWPTVCARCTAWIPRSRPASPRGHHQLAGTFDVTFVAAMPTDRGSPMAVRLEDAVPPTFSSISHSMSSIVSVSAREILDSPRQSHHRSRRDPRNRQRGPRRRAQRRLHRRARSRGAARRRSRSATAARAC